MRGMFMAGTAELFYLKPVLMLLLVLLRRVISIFANLAL